MSTCMHTHKTQIENKHTHICVSHVPMILPYLPYKKQEGGQCRRQENSDVFNICILTPELKTEDDNCRYKHLSGFYMLKTAFFNHCHRVVGSCDGGLSTCLACSIHFKVFILKSAEECILNIYKTEQKPLSSGHHLCKVKTKFLTFTL